MILIPDILIVKLMVKLVVDFREYLDENKSIFLSTRKYILKSIASLWDRSFLLQLVVIVVCSSSYKSYFVIGRKNRQDIGHFS